ncbi:MAG: signal peptidase II [Solirubrobacteraceae bacterium]|nr:signal peptidase II [Solirubrobacteraceae bacterium]
MSRHGIVIGVAAVVAVDQAVKALVRADVAQGSVRELLPGIDLVHTKNTGVSFGFLADAPAWVVGLTSTAALVIVVALLARVAPGKPGRVAAALIAGGALGNLIDRIALGSVTDFLDLPLLPPCNIADVAITFGALTMAVAILLTPDDRAHPASGAGQVAKNGSDG